jgi:hypothetical protein
MNKLIVEEILRISEIMGVKPKLISEQVSFADDILKAIQGSADDALKQNLDNIISGAGKPGFKTIDDLIRRADSGVDIEKILPGITKQIITVAKNKPIYGNIKGMVIRTLFNDDIIRDITTFEKGSLTQAQYDELYKIINNTITTYPDEEIVGILLDSKTIQRVLSGEPKARGVKKYRVPGKRSVKTGSDVAGDSAKSAEEMAGFDEIKVDFGDSVVDDLIDEDKLANMNAEQIVDEVIDDSKESLRRSISLKNKRFEKLSSDKQDYVINGIIASIKSDPKLSQALKTIDESKQFKQIEQLLNSQSLAPDKKIELVQTALESLPFATKYNIFKDPKKILDILIYRDPASGRYNTKNLKQVIALFFGINFTITAIQILVKSKEMENSDPDSWDDNFFKKLAENLNIGNLALKLAPTPPLLSLAFNSALDTTIVKDVRPASIDEVYEYIKKTPGYGMIDKDTISKREVNPNDYPTLASSNLSEEIKGTMKEFLTTTGEILGVYVWNNKDSKIVPLIPPATKESQTPTTTYENSEEGLKNFLQNGNVDTTDAWGKDDYNKYFEKIEEKFPVSGKTFYKIKIKNETDPKTMYQYMYFDNGQFKYQD